MSMLHDHMSWPRPHLSQFSDDADQLVFHIIANLTLLPSISMASCAFLHSPHHLSLCSPNTQESPTCSVYHELRYFTRFIKLRFYCIDQQIVLLCNPLHKTSLPVGGLLCQILSLLSTSWAYLYIYKNRLPWNSSQWAGVLEMWISFYRLIRCRPWKFRV